MATTVARLQAILGAETKDFDRKMDQSDGKMRAVGKTAGIAGKAIAVGIGAGLGAVAVGAKQSIDAASNLGESINAVNVVFGKASKQLQNFSDKAAKQAGLSMREFNELVTPVGASLINTGYSADQAAKASIALTKRAADMASVFNTDVGTALGAIQAGLRGEADPLERFGVGLSDAAVKAHAMSMGLAASEKALTAQDKAQARVALLLQQTNKLQGDFVNTSDSMANRQRILRAEFENLQAKIGQKLMPVMNTLMGAAIRFSDWVSDTAAPVVSRLIEKLTGGGGGGASLRGSLSSVSGFVTNTLLPAFRGIWSFIDANLLPIFRQVKEIVGTAIANIGAVMAENEPELRRILNLAKDIGTAFLTLVNKVFLPVLKPMLTKALPSALNIVIEVLDKFALVVGKIVDGIKWVGDNAGKIFDKVGAVLAKIPGIGDPRDPTFTGPTHPSAGGINLMGASPVMAPFAMAAASHGLSVTSGLRPGAITANGTPSDHAIGKALDVAGSAAGMASFFKALIGNRSVKQAFYDPLGSIFGGAWNSYREGGHSDHVHVATYDKGGILRPGWTMAYNGTGQNEYVNRGSMVAVVNLDGREIARAIFDPLRNENVRQGRLGRGLGA